ncbi:hypothetical protein EN824_10620 [Mesorhizobium sp. M8A.F.Ca.ET.181.01.1.1]|nr:hypothetical protein EN824_10620 [Mesorhizobium sp. M8A.F.Ca.ET.181.01.1.1]
MSACRCEDKHRHSAGDCHANADAKANSQPQEQLPGKIHGEGADGAPRVCAGRFDGLGEIVKDRFHVFSIDRNAESVNPPSGARAKLRPRKGALEKSTE